MPEERGLYPKMRVGEQLAYLGRLHGQSRQDAWRATDTWLRRLDLAGRRALGLSAVVLVALAAVAGSYGNSVLRTGSRVRLREALPRLG